MAAAGGIGPGGQDAAGQPDDEEALGAAEERAAEPVDAAQEAVAEPAPDGDAGRRAERLAEADREDEARRAR